MRYYLLTLVEDDKKFRNADLDEVSESCLAWRSRDLPRRLKKRFLQCYQDTNMKKLRGYIDLTNPLSVMPSRWTYFLIVDEACLRQRDERGDPFMFKLAAMDHAFNLPDKVADGWADGFTDEAHENVGWMWMERTQYVGMYETLMNPYRWHVGGVYQRPVSKGEGSGGVK